ncbi:MAG: cation diffusion facilitator family transporter [Myxococcota bacterium]
MRNAEDRALARTIAATLGMGAAKLAVALLSGSQALLASAADSLTDGAVSGLNLVLVRQAREPADDAHPWGHGKIEGIAAAVQGIVLSAVVVGVGWKAIATLLGPMPEMPRLGVAAIAIVASMIGSLTISTLLAREAARTGSLVLRTDAVHYRMDLLSSGAVLGGLGMAWWTGDARADAVASLLLCAFMAKDVAGVLNEAVHELMDRPLEAEELAVVKRTLESFDGRVISWHQLRTRRSGPHRFVQVHVVLPAQLSFAEAHAISDDVEQALRKAVPNCDVLVHADVEGEHDATDAGPGA